MSYIVNLAIAIVTYCGLSLAFPPEGLGVTEPWDESPVVGEGLSRPEEAAAAEEKEEHVSEVECLSSSAKG